jgi:hypothetical protein
MPAYLVELLWLIGSLFLLTILQRYFHKVLQAIFLLLTHNLAITVSIFSFLFLPGVIIHELSHFGMAKILRIRTGKISLMPKILPKGKVQLGYVEVASADFFRDSLVGLAPLISGMTFILLIAIYQFKIPLFEKSGLELLSMFPQLSYILKTNDAWIWIYLVFTISTTMMPSESDRHAWLPVILFSFVLFALAIFFGAGFWMEKTLSEPFTQFIQIAVIIFSISNFMHIVFYLPLFLVKIALSKITGYQVN